MFESHRSHSRCPAFSWKNSLLFLITADVAESYSRTLYYEVHTILYIIYMAIIYDSYHMSHMVWSGVIPYVVWVWAMPYDGIESYCIVIRYDSDRMTHIMTL